LKALDGRKACLMANHGLTCFEKDLSSALALAVEVEHLAEVYGRVLAIGEPSTLSDSEMKVVLEKFKTYGVQDT
jgi:L-fuculose-phosphate aldolase